MRKMRFTTTTIHNRIAIAIVEELMGHKKYKNSQPEEWNNKTPHANCTRLHTM
jgi:hypothetical protein